MITPNECLLEEDGEEMVYYFLSTQLRFFQVIAMKSKLLQ